LGIWDPGERWEILVETPEGRRPLGRTRSRWDDSIEMDPRGIYWEGTERVHVAQNGNQWWVLVNTVMNLRVP